MRNRLLIFGSFAHDAQGVLAAVSQLALVCVELGFDFLLRIGLKLPVTMLTYGNDRRCFLYDSQTAFRHGLSLAQFDRATECL